MEMLKVLINSLFSQQLFLSFLLGVICYLSYTLSLRYVKGLKNTSLSNRRRLMVGVRNGWLFLFIGLVIFIWFEQIHNVATGLLVVAAAVVIATKELILNFLGYIYKSGAQQFHIGDRIQVGEIYGDVIDQGVMGVTLLEIGGNTRCHQYTGRAVFVPNVQFLATAVFNESFLHDYCFHMITIPVKKHEGWEKREQALLQAATEVSASYIDQARDFMDRVERKYSLDAPSADPRIHLHVESEDMISMVLRVPVLTAKRGRLEQAIIRRYLELLGVQDLLPKESEADTSETGK